jgi:F0F1-type ATP synthase epsilon subunit
MSILTDLAIAAENIDEAKAEEACERAAARLRERLSSSITSLGCAPPSVSVTE